MSKDMKLIMEQWDKFVIQEQTLQPHQIMTVGQLVQYFQNMPKNKAKKIFGRFTPVIAAAVGAGAGAATINPAIGAVAGVAAEKITSEFLSKLLTTSVIAFANIDDSIPKPPGSAAFYFDMDDQLQYFFRHLETKGNDINSVSDVEKKVFYTMQKYIKRQLKASNYDPNESLSDILGRNTSDYIVKNALKQGKFSGKVEVEPIENT